MRFLFVCLFPLYVFAGCGDNPAAVDNEGGDYLARFADTHRLMHIAHRERPSPLLERVPVHELVSWKFRGEAGRLEYRFEVEIFPLRPGQRLLGGIVDKPFYWTTGTSYHEVTASAYRQIYVLTRQDGSAFNYAMNDYLPQGLSVWDSILLVGKGGIDWGGTDYYLVTEEEFQAVRKALKEGTFDERQYRF